MSEKAKLLFVEDDELILKYGMGLFNKGGFLCRGAADGWELAQVIEGELFNPEVAVIDVCIPEVGVATEQYLNGLTGGLAICAFLLTKIPRLRTIIWCGLNNYRENVQKAGAWAYVEKRSGFPTKIPDLYAAMLRGMLTDIEVGQPTIKFSK